MNEIRYIDRMAHTFSCHPSLLPCEGTVFLLSEVIVIGAILEAETQLSQDTRVVDPLILDSQPPEQ
jgi:hypothetical protein